MLREANSLLPSSGLPLQVDYKAPANLFNNSTVVKECLISLQALDGFLVGEGENSITCLQAFSQYQQELFVSYLSALARFFGLNARQDASHLYLSKSDFDGLTTLVKNTPESLFVALALQAMHAATTNDSIITVESLAIEFLKINNASVIQNTLIIKILRLLPSIEYELQETDVLITPANILR